MNKYIMVAAIMLSAWSVRAEFDIILTNDTAITAANTNYDYKSILISGCSVTINGLHTFLDLYLSNSATLTHPAATTNAEYSVNLIISNTVKISTGCRIDVSEKGYLPGRTAGNTTNGASTAHCGGSYGGFGGFSNGVLSRVNGVYGDFRNPNELGSGSGPENNGGAGGGLVRIKAGILEIEGFIYAKGTHTNEIYCGGGSGGGIYLDVGTLKCSYIASRIMADGGDASSGTGGGGRIAIYYNNVIGEDPIEEILVSYPPMASGGYRTGPPWEMGERTCSSGGTIYIQHSNDLGTLIYDNFEGNTADSIITPLFVPAGNSNYYGAIIVKGYNGNGARIASDTGMMPTNVMVMESGILTIDGNMSIGDLILTNGSTLTHSAATTNTESLMNLTVFNRLYVDSDSAIDVAWKGYLPGRTFGNTTNGASTGLAGASYGGLGLAHNDDVVNGVYGDFRNPNELGSGGPEETYISYGDTYNVNSFGGGLIRIKANILELQGKITTDVCGWHYNYSLGYYSGSSGGGIYLDIGTIKGEGSVSANGGMGGGGGRIALYYDNNEGFNLTNNIEANAGVSAGGLIGSPGTVYIQHSNDVGELIITDDNQPTKTTPIYVPAGTNYSGLLNLTVKGSAVKACIDTNMSLANLTITNGAILTHSAANTNTRYYLNLTVSNRIYISSNSAVDATGKGYPQGWTHESSSNGPSTGQAGGSYGGLGGAGNGVPNVIYGSDSNPNELGSGAGPENSGGAGGGLVRLHADYLDLYGVIKVDGENYRAGDSGGGSGGGIFLNVGTIKGPGTLSANGGSGNGASSGGGGGGRIAVYCGIFDGFVPTNQIYVSGGSGGGAGNAGTLYVTNQPLFQSVLSVMPTGPEVESISYFDICFGSKVDTNTFTLDDLNLTGPYGVIGFSNLNYISDTEYRAWPDSVLSVSGSYTLAIGPDIKNVAGYAMESVYSKTYIVDSYIPAAPVVTNYLVAPFTNIVTNVEIILYGTRETNTSVWIDNNLRVSAGSDPWNYNISATQGLNRIFVYAKNQIGTSSPTNSYYFVADSITPAITAVSPANGALTNVPPSVTLFYQELESGLDLNGSQLSLSRSGAAIPGNWAIASTNALTFTPSGSLLDGDYSVSAILKDNAGWTSSPFSSSFSLDTVPPAQPIVNPVSSPTTIATQQVSGVKETNSAILMNGIEVVAFSALTDWSNSVSLVEGSNLLTFVARDAANNTSPATNVVIIYGNLPPGPVSNMTADVYGNGTVITLDWSGYDENANGADISFYTVYKSAASFTNVSEAQSIATRSAGVKTFLVTGLTRNETNYYAVMATDITGLSDSNVTSIAAAPLDNVAPPDPSGLAFQCFDDRLVVSWTASANPDADLKGYRIYVTNETTGAEVSNSVVSYERAGLSRASAYHFRVTAFDNDTNESAGAAAMGYTLMDNPTNITAEPYSGKASLSWDAVQPSTNIGYFAVYCSETDFSSVSGMASRLTTTNLSASVAGLQNNVTNYFAVTTVNKSGGETKSVVTIPVVPRPDTNGPALSGLKWNSAAVPAAITGPGTISISASDPAGVGRVEFRMDGVMLKTQTGAGPDFSCFWNAATTTNDGAHALSLVAWDTLGNSNAMDTNLTVTLAVPSAPVIASPASGILVNNSNLTVSGSADPYASAVAFYINDVRSGAPVSIISTGLFSGALILGQGTNLIQAVASNRAGESAKSTAVSVVLDASIPPAPSNVKAEAREGGVIAVNWWAPVGVNIKGYNIYRSTTSFSATNEAVKLNADLLTGVAYNDLPSADGTNFYRVIAVNTVDTHSPLSSEASAVSDGTLPRALAITLTTTGHSVPAENRFAAGAISLNLTVSEPLLTTPFLSLTPNMGLPIVISLQQNSATNYSGSFIISSNTPSGTAWFNFSCRDLVGNRGTTIDSNSNLVVDTAGPAANEVQVTPAAPIRNDSSNPTTITAVLVFNAGDLPVGAPELFYSLSQTAPTPVSVPLSPLTTLSWAGNITLPASAGSVPEQVHFTYRGTDNVYNVGTVISGVSDFEVYQGTNIPALDPPTGLTGRALPGGEVSLAWNTVTNAADYRVYRKAPGEADFSPRAYTSGQLIFQEAAPEGSNAYAVASVRRANGEESIGALSAAIGLLSDSNPPPAPGTPTMVLAGNGINLSWPASQTSEEVKYELYRSSSPITPQNIVNLTALITNIASTYVLDQNPLQDHLYYVVTAVDAAGNESAPSSGAYTNLAFLPVNYLSVTHTVTGQPVIAWTHPNPSGVSGFNVYVGAAGAETKMNTNLLAAGVSSYVDSGYANGAVRRYTVRAVDMVGTNPVESAGRVIVLPNVSAEFSSSAALKRGIVNRLNFAVHNGGASSVYNMRLRMVLDGQTSLSDPFSLNANASSTVPFVVGGQSSLPDAPLMTSTLEIALGNGDTVSIVSSTNLTASDGFLSAEILNKEFVRGATGKAQFTLHNTSADPVDIVVGWTGGRASDQVRFKLQDQDGSTYSVAPVSQASGAQLLTMPNGAVVARLAAGAEFTSDDTEITVPTNTPENAVIKLEVDSLYYHYSDSDQIIISGLTGSRAISLKPTAYTAAVTNVSPALAVAMTNFTITGKTVAQSGTNAPYAPFKLTVCLNGFERVADLVSGAAGSWSYTFTPGENEYGLYKVWAVHPDVLDKPVQAQFALSRVLVSPSVLTIRTYYTNQQQCAIAVTPTEGLALSNLALAFLTEDQTNTVPEGLHVVITNAPLAEAVSNQTVNLPFSVWGDSTVTNSGSVILRVTSDEAPGGVWARVTMHYKFWAASPVLNCSPNYIHTGVATSNSVMETVVLRNAGLTSAENVGLMLLTTNGAALPAWVMLNAASNQGALAVNASKNIPVTFAPSNGVSSATYRFILRVTADNAPTNDVYMDVTVDDSGAGEAILKVTDLYTGYSNSGVSGAKITLYKQDGTFMTTNLITDAVGEADFKNLPAGRYKYSATADKHDILNGTVWIKPGVVWSQELFMQYRLVTVEWSVRPVEIEDCYEIVLNATFETDVPAPVVVPDPVSISLPEMHVGDVFTGMFTYKNYGLINAERFKLNFNAADDLFRVEFMTNNIPERLAAQASFELPFRVICLKEPDASGGGGCYSWTVCHYFDAYYYDARCETWRYFRTVDACQTYTYGSCPGSGPSGPPAPSTPPAPPTPPTPPQPPTPPNPSPNEEPSPQPPVPPVPTNPSGPGNPEQPVAGDFCPPELPECRPGGSLLNKGECKNKCNRNESVGPMDVDLGRGKGIAAFPGFSIQSPLAISPNSLAMTAQGVRLDVELTDLQVGTVDEATGKPETIEDENGTYTPANQASTIYNMQDDNDRVIVETENGYQYRNTRNGNWRSYDTEGRLQSYGDSRGIEASLMRSATNEWVTGIRDCSSNQVVWIERDTNGWVTAMADAAEGGRRYEYEYDQAGHVTNVTDVIGRRTGYIYNGSNLTAVIAPNGVQTLFEYNQFNYVSKVSRTNGYVRTFEYGYDSYKQQYYNLMQSAAGRVIETWLDSTGQIIHRDQNGRTTYDGNNRVGKYDPTYTYDANGNPVLIRYPDGATITREYNGPNGEMSREINEAGIVTTYAYDSQGNLTNKVEAEGTTCARQTIMTYDTNNNLTASIFVNPSGTNAVTSWTYNQYGNVLTETDAMGGVTSNAYDQYRNLVSVTDPAGRVRTMTYDLAGRLITETDFAGNITSNTYDLADNVIRRDILTADLSPLASDFYQYDSENRVICESNYLGRVTTRAYDTDGNLIETIEDMGPPDHKTRQVEMTYNTDGQVVSQRITVDGESWTEYVVYDGNGRLAQSTDASGRITETQYESDSDNVKKIIYPTFTREYIYDQRGRVATQKDIVNGQERITTYTYSTDGQVVSQTDPLNRVTSYEYDALGRRVAEINALNATNRVEYDIQDRLTKLVDAKGNETAFAYDLGGRLTHKTYADNSHVDYTYDTQGQLTEKLDAKGQKTNYAYDQLGHLVTNLFYDSSEALVKTVSYLYDARGRMTSWNDGTYSGTFSYDDTNRTQTVTVDYGPFSKTYSYHYNAWGQKISCQYPDGTTYQYAYDGQGRLIGMEIPDEGTISFSLDQWGKVSGATLPGGSCKTFGYNCWQALTTNRAIDPAENSLMNRAYVRNSVGNILGQQTEQGDYDYGYDLIDQLTNVNIIVYTGPSGAATNESFAYDAMGNRSESSRAVADALRAASYSANTLNQYTQVIESTDGTLTTNIFQYDINGNLTNQVTGGLITNQYFWDIENRLIEFKRNTASNSIVAQYAYDPFGTRLGKVVNGITNYFLYADEGLIGEFDAFGSNINSYGYAPDSLWMNNSVFLMQPSTTGPPQYYYYLNDHLGAPQKLVAKNGAEVWSASVFAFGETLVNSSSIITNNLRISSQYFDAESDLHYNTYRCFDTQDGRYISRDPIGEDGGLNLFCFVQNRPVNMVDELGLDSPGCDVPSWAKKITDANDCFLGCCAVHDKCYRDNECTRNSWCVNILIGTLTQCARCNDAAARCFVRCATKWKPKSPEGKYYCGKHNVWFNDPTSPHMRCSTDKK